MAKRDMPVVGFWCFTWWTVWESREHKTKKKKAVGPGYMSEFYSTVPTLSNTCHPPLSGKWITSTHNCTGTRFAFTFLLCSRPWCKLHDSGQHYFFSFVQATGMGVDLIFFCWIVLAIFCFTSLNKKGIGEKSVPLDQKWPNWLLMSTTKDTACRFTDKSSTTQIEHQRRETMVSVAMGWQWQCSAKLEKKNFDRTGSKGPRK